jgi:hypothetical protein
MTKKQQKTGISRRQEIVLLALLENPSISHVSKATGTSRNTIYKYLDNPEFSRLYRKKRRENFSQSVALLNRASSVAIQKLLEMIVSPTTVDSARISAIRCVLQYNESGIESEVTSYDANELRDELDRQKSGYE